MSDYWSRLGRRRLSRRRFLVGGGVAAAGSAALLAGCGSDPPPTVPVATEESPARAEPASPTTTAAPTAAPTPPPRRGGTLRLWKPRADDGLDPGIYRVNNQDILYPTLTQPLTYQPTRHLFAMDGMVGYEQVDPVTLVWNIRPGMRFHNGDPVDAEAVAFSFGRLQKLYDLYRERGKVTHVRRHGFDFVDSFEATDALTLTEHWSRPTADALVHRARHYYSFLNPRVVEQEGAFEGTYELVDGTTEDLLSVQKLPLGSGSGPYVLTKRDETSTRVERWPDYHVHTPADDGFVEEGPYIAAWETRILPDRQAAKTAFLAGELDVFDLIEPQEFPEFAGLSNVSTVEVPARRWDGLGMDGAKLHDKRARQALQKAFDYEGFITTFRPPGGTYVGPLSDLLLHFRPLSQQELKEWYRHDPEEARRLWDAADFKVPLTKIRILEATLSSPWKVTFNAFLATSLSASLGIETEPYVWNSQQDMAGSGGSGAHEWDIAHYEKSPMADVITGIPGDSYLDHYDPLGVGSNLNFRTDSPQPEIAEDSVEIIAMLEAQEQELDFDARAELLTEIQRWILDRAWCNLALPVSSVSYYGFSSRLRDHAPDDWLNHYGLRRESMWLADV